MEKNENIPIKNLSTELIRHLELLKESKQQLQEQTEKLKKLKTEVTSFIKKTAVHCDLDCKNCSLSYICQKPEKED